MLNSRRFSEKLSILLKEFHQEIACFPPVGISLFSVWRYANWKYYFENPEFQKNIDNDPLHMTYLKICVWHTIITLSADFSDYLYDRLFHEILVACAASGTDSRI